MTEEAKETRKTCWLAKLSMFCLTGVIFIIAVLIVLILLDISLSGPIERLIVMIAPVFLTSSLTLAIVSLVRMRRKPELCKGSKTAKIVIVGALLISMTLPMLSSLYHTVNKVVCGSNLKGLGASIGIYAFDHDDMFSGLNNWCDLLIMDFESDPRVFTCKGSGAVYGESAYALNKNVAGKKFSELPKDIVLAFETNLGIESGRRKSRLRERDSFDKYPETSGFSGKERVYLGRWNQVGGPEDLTVDNHKGEGCNVCFGDWHVEFVKAEDIGKLRWTVE